MAVKCFQQLIKDNICVILLSTQDLTQFGYQSNRSTDDVTNFIVHMALTHLANSSESFLKVLQ